MFSLRLDDATELALERLARKTGLSRSDIVRRAVILLGERELSTGRTESPYEALADVIGCVRGGPGDLSTRTGEKFRRLLAERKLRRR